MIELLENKDTLYCEYIIHEYVNIIVNKSQFDECGINNELKAVAIYIR